MDKPKVSIICLLYNMKEYIAQALDSMLMQKTDFPFEIIVHDDASTDGSTEILREYEKKYPDIIVPIYQTENQYSKKVAITPNFIFPKVRGDYICYCEGDDYWTDPLKLQKQYDFMEAHPDYTLCAAKVRQVNCKDPSVPDRFVGPIDRTCEVSFEKLLEQNEKQSFATCSLFFRKAVMFSRPDDFPAGGDRMMVFWLALNGRVWFINDEVGVYRRARPGSWSESNWENGNEKRVRLFIAYIKKYMQIDSYSEKKYKGAMQQVYVRYMKLALRAGAAWKDITKGDIKECYEGLSNDKKRSLLVYKLLLPARKAASSIKKKLKKKK